MSSLYEQMISAAIDVQLAASTSSMAISNAKNREHASSYPPPVNFNSHQGQRGQLHSYASQMNVIPSGITPITTTTTTTTIQHQTGNSSSSTATGMTTSDNNSGNSNSGNTGDGGSTMATDVVSKAAEQMSSTSNNSSSATAITILTPEPTESASSSAGGSPRSVCSTLVSEQINQDQLMLAEQEAAEKAITCAECANFFDGVTRQPKILECIHTFCEPCLMRRQIPISSNPPIVNISCPMNECNQMTSIHTVAALQTNIPALTMSIVARAIQHLSSPVLCGCLLNQEAAYLCFSCHQLICQNCVATLHANSQHCVESLDLLNLNSIDTACVSRLVDRLRTSRAGAPSLMTVMCPRHPALPVFSYCETCSQPVCQDCTPNHFSTKVGDHVTIHLLKSFDAQTYKHECGFFAAYIKHIRESVMELRSSLDAASRAQTMLNQQHHDSNMAVYQQFDLYVAKATNLHKMYAEQGDEFLSGVTLAGGLEKFMTDVDQLREECRRLNTLFERARENCSAAEMSSLREWVKRKVFDIRQRCRSINQSVNIKRRHSLPLDVRPVIDAELPKLFDPRPVPAGGACFDPLSTTGPNSSSVGYQPNGNPFSKQQVCPSTSHFGIPTPMRSRASYPVPPCAPQWPPRSATMASPLPTSQRSLYHQRSLVPGFNDQRRPEQFMNQMSNCLYGQRYSEMMPNLFEGQQSDEQEQGDSQQGSDNEQQMGCTMMEAGVVTDSPTLIGPTSVAIPNRLQLRYIAKIGQFGEADGQFTEPSGIATNHQNQLVVADTNSHRIQVFNNHGAFLWRFGECGKRAGQVLYPNRIAIGPEGEYVFTERAPQCLVQVFDSTGNFIRRFGSGDLRHPRGLCIDPEGHVLVLECQVMSVTIYDMRGTRLRRFNFEGIRFPSSICVNDQQEIFIADNIQHYVYVYSYEGVMKRRIGGYPTINFPVGVAINHLGQLVVADNHNNFNITVFTQEGIPISGYESCVKHAQVLDVCLLNAGRAVAISCKDYRVYVYPYATDGGSLMDVTAASVEGMAA